MFNRQVSLTVCLGSPWFSVVLRGAQEVPITDESTNQCYWFINSSIEDYDQTQESLLKLKLDILFSPFSLSLSHAHTRYPLAIR